MGYKIQVSNAAGKKVFCPISRKLEYWTVSGTDLRKASRQLGTFDGNTGYHDRLVYILCKGCTCHRHPGPYFCPVEICSDLVEVGLHCPRLYR